MNQEEKKNEIINIHASEPFVAKNPINGIRAYGPFDKEKEVINEERDDDGYKVITVQFENGKGRRKVRLLGDQK